MQRFVLLIISVVLPVAVYAQDAQPLASKEEASDSSLELADHFRRALDSARISGASPENRVAVQERVTDVARAFERVSEAIAAGAPRHVTRDAFDSLMQKLWELNQLSRDVEIEPAEADVEGFLREFNALRGYLAER